jgi:hypothetical protein
MIRLAALALGVRVLNPSSDRSRRRPIFFFRFRIGLAAQQEWSGGGGAEHRSYGVASTTAGSHQEGDGPR